MAEGAPEVFVSYAHADNEYPRYESRDWEGSRGWVECFCEALGKRLRGLRRGTEIWRDGSGGIRGASELTPTIERAIADASILVTISSPAYAQSQWCEKELTLFRERAVSRHGGLLVGTMLRVFRINKLPVSGETFATRIPELADSTGYQLYRYVEGRPLEYEPPYGIEAGARFLAGVNNIAYDIVEVLQGRSAPVAPTGISVYLAETTPDVADYRAKLQSEIEQFGHTVLPGANDARSVEDPARIRSELARARLSVHVVGGEAGPVSPGSSGRSSVELQYDLAGEEAARRSDFTRLTWLAPLRQAPEPAQAAFIERLKNTDPNLLEASLEDVRSLVKQQLEAKPPSRAKPAAGEVRIVYLMFDSPDEDSAKPLATWLFDQGFEVLKPARSGNLLKAHKVNLRDSHGALIYYGEVNDAWLTVKLADLRKTLVDSQRKTHEFKGAVYLGDPASEDKNDLRLQLFDIIPGFGRFRPELLKAFADKLHESTRA
jgi:hypothetical protein